jgi:hypothetical protein
MLKARVDREQAAARVLIAAGFRPLAALCLAMLAGEIRVTPGPWED